MTAVIYILTENSIRLVGGSSSLEGRVEVCVNGDWGTVTHDNWDYLDASVVCRELGFSSLGTIWYALFFTHYLSTPIILYIGAVDGDRARFGRGIGAIVLDFVRCIGNELNLTSCGPNYDNHFEDAGVVCKPGKGISLYFHKYHPAILCVCTAVFK